MQTETLKIQHTVQPEEKLSKDQWMNQYFAGARLKPEIQPFSACPLDAYLKFIESALNTPNN